MANAAAITLRALSEASASGSGDAIDLGESRSALRLSLVVTALGTSLAVTLETSPDGSTGWRAVEQLETILERQRIERSFIELDRYVRLTWVQVGTAPTFGCDGTAYTTYASRGDLVGRSSNAIIKRAEAQDRDAVANALIDASSTAESEMLPAHGTPLTKWPSVVKRNTAALALYDLAVMGAFQGAGLDELVVKNRDDAESWFKRVGKRDVHIAGAEPKGNAQVRMSSGNGSTPECYPAKFSDDWGDF